MSFHNLNGTDEIPVLKRCRKCGGTKEVRDAEGNTSPCTICDDKGKEIVPVRMRDIAEFVAEYMAKEIRLQGGIHR